MTDADLALVVLGGMSLVVLFGALWSLLSLMLDRPTASEREEAELPKLVVKIPEVPVYVPRKKVVKEPEPVLKTADPDPGPAPVPQVVSLSKFREERAKRRGYEAVLPRAGPGCEICKGVRLVWIQTPTEWIGYCRRCGLPFARVAKEDWQLEGA